MKEKHDKLTCPVCRLLSPEDQDRVEEVLNRLRANPSETTEFVELTKTSILHEGRPTHD